MKRVTTWGCKTGHRSQTKNIKKKYEYICWKKNARPNFFCVEVFPQFYLFEAQKNLSNVAMTISQWKPGLEKLELQPSVVIGSSSW